MSEEMVEPNVLRPLGTRSRMPLGLQVAAGVGVLVALVALSALVAVLLIVGLRNDQAKLHTQSVPYANAVAAAALRAKAIANDERGYLITADPQFVAQIEERIPKAQAAFTQAYGLAEGSAQQLAVVEAHAGFERWIVTVRKEIALVKAGNQKRAIESALGPGRAVRHNYERSLGRAEALARSEIAADQDSVTTASSRSVTILVACLVLALVVAAGVAFWLMRTILRPVYTLLGLLGETPRPSPSER